MKSNLNDIPAMAREATERALHHAMAIDLAEKSHDRNELWGTACEMAMDARGAALMTLNSTMMETCPAYRVEHGDNYIDLAEDMPGSSMQTHECGGCQALQQAAQSLRHNLKLLWTADYRELDNDSPEMDRVRKLHSAMLETVHMAIALCLEIHNELEPEEDQDNPGQAEIPKVV